MMAMAMAMMIMVVVVNSRINIRGELICRPRLALLPTEAAAIGHRDLPTP